MESYLDPEKPVQMSDAEKESHVKQALRAGEADVFVQAMTVLGDNESIHRSIDLIISHGDVKHDVPLYRSFEQKGHEVGWTQEAYDAVLYAAPSFLEIIKILKAVCKDHALTLAYSNSEYEKTKIFNDGLKAFTHPGEAGLDALCDQVPEAGKQPSQTAHDAELARIAAEMVRSQEKPA